MKYYSIRVYCLSLALFVNQFGCGAEEAAEEGVTASECVQNDLIGQCPPNTMPMLEADSVAVCNESTSASIDGAIGSGEGQINNVCVGSGTCRVVCELITPCEFGVESVSPTDGITCRIPTGGCGDGTCEAGEDPVSCPQDCESECTRNTSRCSAGRLERCDGTGRWEAPVECLENEECQIVGEDGDQAQCVAVPFCGDGVVNQDFEDCDDGEGNRDDLADACRSNCKNPSCGDGVKDPANGEACDFQDPNVVGNCNESCLFADCNNGVLDEGEECDDGDSNSDETPDACRTNCLEPFCGDGVVDGNEECDFGDSGNTTACEYDRMSCQVCHPETCRRIIGSVSYCGDGVTDEANGEECDDGRNNGVPCEYGFMSCLICDNSCRSANGVTSYCGDNTVQGDEVCDENNSDNGLCTTACEPARCGDGLHLQGLAVSDAQFEYCDDGNTVDMDDGCNQNCELTEKKEDLTPPTPVVCNNGSSNDCNLRGSIRSDGQCLYDACYYNNPLPLFEAGSANRRSGSIHGVLAHNASLPADNRRDRDVFGFTQLCGYPSLAGNQGTDCTGDNSAVYYFTVDYEGGGVNPFTVQQDCNGVQGSTTMACSFNIANFCDAESRLAVCNANNRPAGTNRAYWCTKAGVVGEYRVWLHLQADDTVEYTLSVREQVGSENCIYLQTPSGPVRP